MTSFTSRVPPAATAAQPTSTATSGSSAGILKKFDFVLDTTALRGGDAAVASSTGVLASGNHGNKNGVNGVSAATSGSSSAAVVVHRDLHDDDDDLLRSGGDLESDAMPTAPGAVFHAHTAQPEGEERLYFQVSFWRMFWERTLWLVGLLLLQSYASLILEQFEALLQKHLVITLFLPMLIGAGGNASNQSAMVVVRGLATGELISSNTWRLVARELMLAVFIGLTMGSVAYVRVLLFHSVDGSSAAAAVGTSTLAVMLLAIALGTTIPLLLNFVKIDPAHAGPVVAVLVDLSGVAIILLVCQLILD